MKSVRHDIFNVRVGTAPLSRRKLKDLDFTDVTSVVMTLDEWQKADHPFVKQEHEPFPWPVSTHGA